VALSAVVSLVVIATLSIFIGAAPWQILSSFFAQGQCFEYPLKETTLSEYIVFLLLFAIFIYFIKHIYDNWQGTITIVA
jgi:hypothetical protein